MLAARVLLLASWSGAVMLEDASHPLTEQPRVFAHTRFTPALSALKAEFVNTTDTLATAQEGTRASSDDALMPKTLARIATAVTNLRKVRAQIATDGPSSPAVRQQVLWNMDKIISNAERLQAESLSPLARGALVKALSLRFTILLTKSFWQTPVKRDALFLGTPGDHLQLHQSAAESGDAVDATHTRESQGEAVQQR